MYFLVFPFINDNGIQQPLSSSSPHSSSQKCVSSFSRHFHGGMFDQSDIQLIQQLSLFLPFFLSFFLSLFHSSFFLLFFLPLLLSFSFSFFPSFFPLSLLMQLPTCMFAWIREEGETKRPKRRRRKLENAPHARKGMHNYCAIATPKKEAPSPFHGFPRWLR